MPYREFQSSFLKGSVPLRKTPQAGLFVSTTPLSAMFNGTKPNKFA